MKLNTLSVAVSILSAFYISAAHAQPKPFDEAAYKSILHDMKRAMTGWHAAFVTRIQPTTNDVIVEALNFYTYGDPTGPGTLISMFKTIDTGWKNAGNCVYQRVLTEYNDVDGTYIIRGKSALMTLDLNKIDWNSSTVKSDFNTLTNKRFYNVTLAGRSNDFYSEMTNFVAAGDASSRKMRIGSVDSSSTYEAGDVDAPLERIQKSLALAKAQCAGIKSSF